MTRTAPQGLRTATAGPPATWKRPAASYREAVTSPLVAAEARIIDDIILPEETRDRSSHRSDWRWAEGRF